MVLYQIRASISDIGANITDKKAFVEATHKFADEQIDDSGLKTAITNIDIDEKAGFVIATVKDVNALTEEEKTSVAQFKVDSLKKERLIHSFQNKKLKRKKRLTLLF